VTTPTPRPTTAASATRAPVAGAAPTPGVAGGLLAEIKWVASPNYWPGRPDGDPIALVIHTAAGTMAGMDRWFSIEESESSAHFGIGLDGSIHQYVNLGDRSWTNGILETGNSWPGPDGTEPNHFTVNIETEDKGIDVYPVTEDQYQATLRVGKLILARYPKIKYLMTHRSLDPKTRVHDPGPRWLDSGRFSALAKELRLIPIQ
jgi:N-acetyl-anhydromuramyl-L-alanine amidase AmpD